VFLISFYHEQIEKYIKEKFHLNVRIIYRGGNIISYVYKLKTIQTFKVYIHALGEEQREELDCIKVPCNEVFSYFVALRCPVLLRENCGELN
jgi:hypothetical protein